MSASEAKRFEAAMDASEALREKYGETCQKIADSGVTDDFEIMSRACKELGYDITPAEVEAAAKAAGAI